MAQPWMYWPLAEGGTKTTSRLLQKFLGLTGKSLASTFFVTIVIGLIQMAGGYVLSGGWPRLRQVQFRQAAMSILFGIVASVMTVISFLTFTYEGADVGVTTFLVTLSIIPGAIVDWLVFGNRLRLHQWFGVAAFLAAGYAILDFPPLGLLASLPVWVWLSLANALLAVLAEAIVQARKEMDPFAFNFWVGLTTTLFCAVWIMAAGWRDVFVVLPPRFWIASVAISAVVLVMIYCMVSGYKAGGNIAMKKFIMYGAFLITSTALGILLYREPASVGKAVGVLGFFIAFAFMDRGAWELVRGIRIWPIPASK